MSTDAQRMIAEQLRPNGVVDERVLGAIESIPRERFLAAPMRRHAYEDRALAIECGQTISQPLVVALMTLAEHASAVLRELGIDNVDVVVADGSLGWPSRSPYDVILVACAAAGEPPPALVEQLADGGRLIVPVAVSPDTAQDLRLYTRHGSEVAYRSLFPVLFVPLRPG